jgi:hypothetical protein
MVEYARELQCRICRLRLERTLKARPLRLAELSTSDNITKEVTPTPTLSVRLSTSRISTGFALADMARIPIAATGNRGLAGAERDRRHTVASQERRPHVRGTSSASH